MSTINKEEISTTNKSSQDLNLFTAALDASVTGIVITDSTQPDNPIIYCNEAFGEITGYERQEIIGHNCRFLQKDDRNQSQRDVLRKAIKEGTNCVVEIRNYKKDGTLFWNELYLSSVKNSAGEVTNFVGIQNNVSRRKKAEQDLEHQQVLLEQKVAERTKVVSDSEEYLNSIIQTVRESLVVLDPQFKVLSVNPHFLKTFKVSAGETTGRLLYSLGNGQWDIPGLRLLLEGILPTNNPVEEFEVEHDFPHIGRKVMLLNAHRIELEGQYKDRILIAIEDITDRREIERRKDDFLSIASHELKTPLTTIKGYMQVMTRLMPENASEKFKSVVDKTGVFIERLNNLISGLLDVSRIQTGNIELHKIVFDFDKMVTETVDHLQTASKTHQLIINGKTGINYLGDEAHIVQVMNNLVSNAIKYSPDEAEVVINLSLVSDYLKVSVTDKGLGISLDDQKKVFERFFRVSDVQQRFPGMGIGLYVCEQIIKNHGGTLWVESEKGKGSTFSFTLPLSNKEPKHE